MFDFYGRAGRLAYLGFSFLSLALGIAGLAATSALDPSFADVEDTVPSPATLAGLCLLAVACLWIWLSAGVRRCHDLGWSGWWILLRLIPIVGFVQALWLLFAPGEEGDNEYGAPG